MRGKFREEMFGEGIVFVRNGETAYKGRILYGEEF